jgi:uncharacterized membrane protein required for colicin V production
MEINYLLIITALILLFCVIRGARRGMLRIVFGIIAWVFLICFVNYGSNFIDNYISTSTQVPYTIQESIVSHLTERYTASEEQEAGTGEEAVMSMVPSSIKEEITERVQNSIDATIRFIAEELTDAAINGISTIIAVLIGILVIYIIDKIIKGIGLVPGIKDVNRLLGVVAGLLEGMLAICLLMYIASCFPASAVGHFVIENAEKDQLLYFVYENNIIARIIGK